MSSRLVEDVHSQQLPGFTARRTTPVRPPASDDRLPAPEWSVARRVAFRFVCSYLVLYLFPTPLSSIPYVGKLTGWYDPLWSAIVPWVGAHVLHLASPVSLAPSGSGDKMYDYVWNLCILILAVASTLLWSLADRRRKEYATAHAWLRVYVRYSLAFVALSYGGFKVIKSQFPFPGLETLLEPYGESSPMKLIWTFMGYSMAYNVFTGLGEMVGGALLFFRRTATAGALLLIAVMSNIVLINFAYDVPVKLYSANLLLMAFFILAPDARRLYDVLVRNRAVDPVNLDAPSVSPRMGRWGIHGRRVLKVVFVGLAVGLPLRQSWKARREYGDLTPHPPLYGIYDVETFVLNHDTLAPLLTDTTRWRRAIVSRPGALSVKLMNDSLRRYALKLDTTRKQLTISPFADSTKKSILSYASGGGDRLSVSGKLGGDSVRMRLHRMDLTTFRLVSRGYHWINEVPFNK